MSTKYLPAAICDCDDIIACCISDIHDMTAEQFFLSLAGPEGLDELRTKLRVARQLHSIRTAMQENERLPSAARECVNIVHDIMADVHACTADHTAVHGNQLDELGEKMRIAGVVQDIRLAIEREMTIR